MVFKFWFVVTKNVNEKVEDLLKKAFGFVTLKVLDKLGLSVLHPFLIFTKNKP